MATKDIRHNGRTYTIETFALPPTHQHFGCVLYYPHFDQQCCPLVHNTSHSGFPVYQSFPTEDEAIAAAINALRANGPERSLLRQFMDALQQSRIDHPRAGRVLRISNVALIDWRALRQTDWQADKWTCNDEALTSMAASDDGFLVALRDQLKKVDVADVEVSEDVGYMEIVSQ